MVKRFFVLRRTVVKKQKFKMFSLAFFLEKRSFESSKG